MFVYRFNGGKNVNNTPQELRRTKKSGWPNGLRLELYTGDQNTQQQYTYKSGVRVIVVRKKLL